MKKLLSAISILVLFFSNYAIAQVTIPPSGDNQRTVIKQYIGPLVSITIDYNSPDVTGPNGEDRKGKIWGALIPYGLNRQGFGLNNPSPWRAGANENTTIEFSHDVLLQGKEVKAGKYGFFVAPEELGSWTIYLSNKTEGWGSYYFDQDDVVGEFRAEPVACEHEEWLTYEFTERRSNFAICELKWESKALPFKIEVENIDDLHFQKLKSEMGGQKGFVLTNLNTAVGYCLQKNIHLETALKWADRAVNDPFFGDKNFTTLSTKADVLKALGRNKEAEKTMDLAINHPSASVFKIHQYGRSLIADGDYKKALAVFKLNAKRNKSAWPSNVGLARAYSAIGEYKKALKYAKKALAEAPDDRNKENLTKSLDLLKQGKDIN